MQEKPDRLTQFQSKTGREKAAQVSHIRRLRIALPIIAIVLTAVTIIWTFTAGEDITSDIAETTLKTIAKNELVNPRFDSMDSKNQPYTITATSAVRGETDDNLVILTQPAADITLNSGRWLAIKAKTGVFNQDKNRLLLREDIQMYDDEGYQLKTEEMNINIKDETMLSETAVYGQGPAGTITATGMFSNAPKGLLSFKGPATITLNTTGSPSLGGLR